MAELRIGTCSWADEALSKHWYPKGLPAGERLGYYAQHFDTVEVDSTYYRLPAEEMVQRWAERTPDGFVMHVKALGGILFQFPSYVVYKDRSLDYLQWAREQLGDDEMLVEFRHVSWLDDENRDETLRFLEELRATHVVVDAPRIEGAKNVAPTVLALTTPTAYVRLHGRNADTWNKRGGSAAERFDYLYSDDELQEWVGPLRELAGEAEQAFALYNNNSNSPRPGIELQRVAQAAYNAYELRGLLDEAGVPATGGLEPVAR